MLKNIYFEKDKSDLLLESMTALASISQLLKENPTVRLTIEGHCDARNITLGQRRADATLEGRPHVR